MPRSATNLTAILDPLKETQEGRRLRKNILRALGAASTRLDLIHVLDLLSAFESTASMSHVERGLIGQALLAHAVVLYCAATKYGSDGRNSVDVAGLYSKELKVAHRDICDLRDSAIAHRGSGRGELGSQWDIQLVVLVETDEFQDLNFPFVRTNYRAKAILDLARLAEAALAIVHLELGKRKAALLEQIRAVTDPQVLTLLANSPFDPNQFHGSEEMVDAFWTRTEKTEQWDIPEPPGVMAGRRPFTE